MPALLLTELLEHDLSIWGKREFSKTESPKLINLPDRERVTGFKNAQVWSHASFRIASTISRVCQYVILESRTVNSQGKRWNVMSLASLPEEELSEIPMSNVFVLMSHQISYFTVLSWNISNCQLPISPLWECDDRVCGKLPKYLEFWKYILHLKLVDNCPNCKTIDLK